jgi:hypothetical protein
MIPQSAGAESDISECLKRFGYSIYMPARKRPSGGGCWGSRCHAQVNWTGSVRLVREWLRMSPFKDRKRSERLIATGIAR